jgi:hypothetical protein
MGLEPMMISAWKADAVAAVPCSRTLFISAYARILKGN